MTKEQISWLKGHPEYRPLGRVGDFSMFTKRGTLRPDGSFSAVTRASPLDETNGSFGVGILADRRDVMAQAPPAPRPGFQRAASVDKPIPAPIDAPHAMPAPGPLPRKV
jgi:hypothetical protein